METTRWTGVAMVIWAAAIFTYWLGADKPQPTVFHVFAWLVMLICGMGLMWLAYLDDTRHKT